MKISTYVIHLPKKVYVPFIFEKIKQIIIMTGENSKQNQSSFCHPPIKEKFWSTYLFGLSQR